MKKNVEKASLTLRRSQPFPDRHSEAFDFSKESLDSPFIRQCRILAFG
jgi:hypothetical protein